MKHAEFLIWWRREDRANAKSKIVFEQGVGLLQKNNSLCLHCRSFSSTRVDSVFFSKGGEKFGSLCFGYSMVDVFSGKGINVRGIQM